MAGALNRTGGATALPLPMLLSAIPSLPRAVLERLTQRMIDRLDAMDPDADLEDNGDQLDGTGAEDEPSQHQANGAGCAISDAAEHSRRDWPMPD